MTDQSSTSVLFVCMGNICRSPTAEGVFRKVVADAGLSDRFEIDSAGTHAFHTNEPPDHRARAAAQRRGIALDDIRARRVCDADFQRFDYVLAMDEDNLDALLQRCADEQRSRVRLFLEFAGATAETEMPDPYYGGTAGFEQVLDLVTVASDALLQKLRQGFRSGGVSR